MSNQESIIVVAPDQANRLAKLCGMLGLDHDGERAAAALKATEMLRSLGLTWRQLVDAATRQASQAPAVKGTTLSPRRWHSVIADLLDDPPTLFDAEADFLPSMLRTAKCRFAPSPKQAAWLHKIAERTA